MVTGQPLKRSLQCRSPTIPLHHMRGNSLCPSCCIRLFIDLSSACSMITAAQALHCSLLQACHTNDNSLHLLFLSNPLIHHSIIVKCLNAIAPSGLRPMAFVLQINSTELWIRALWLFVKFRSYWGRDFIFGLFNSGCFKLMLGGGG